MHNLLRHSLSKFEPKQTNSVFASKVTPAFVLHKYDKQFLQQLKRHPYYGYTHSSYTDYF
jgi:hypothetical protein